MKKIIVDMFGADGGPEIVVRGAARALVKQKEYDVVLAGSTLIAEIVLREEAVRMGVDPVQLISRVSVIETNSFVTNTDDPRCMVKDRNDSSMVMALEALKSDDDIIAMVTAGSTGCALVGSCFHLGLEKGLLQPALASAILKEGGGFTILLDCGSNLNPQPKDLESYARLGAALCRKAFGVKDPAVGLVNVGCEKGKGTELLKAAFDRLEAAQKEDFRFVGNIEGGDIISGKVDVAVCDGFTGNVIIKGFESVGLLSAEFAQEYETILRAGAPEDSSDLQQEGAPGEKADTTGLYGSKKIRRFFDYNSQAGAIFLGTKKIIIKAHGAATEDTIESCILQAIDLARNS